MNKPADPPYSKVFREWFVAEYVPGKPLHDLFESFREKMTNARQVAVQRGDTEFEKGRYAALRDVCDKPESVLKAAQADT